MICLNRPVDAALAEALLEQFVEVVLAPQLHRRGGRDPARASRTCASSRTASGAAINIAERDIKRVLGGLLVQDRDIDLEDRTEMEVVTERKPSEREWGEMLFAWKVCKHVRSNAIVLAQRPRVGRASAPAR